jgi:Rrf2 family protein
MRAVLDIAQYGGNGPVAVKDISRRQNIPARFLEQVMTALKKGGIVESFRGPTGGYVLAKAPKNITLADVVEAVEGPVVIMDCLVGSDRQKGCDMSSECAIREVFGDVQSAVNKTLAAVTVSDMIKKAAARKANAVPMFEI